MKSSQLGKRKNEVAKGCGVDRKDIRWVSSAKGIGIPELRQELHNMFEYEAVYDEDTYEGEEE